MIERGGILSLNLDLANVLVLEYWKQRRNTTSNIIPSCYEMVEVGHGMVLGAGDILIYNQHGDSPT